MNSSSRIDQSDSQRSPCPRLNRKFKKTLSFDYDNVVNRLEPTFRVAQCYGLVSPTCLVPRWGFFPVCVRMCEMSWPDCEKASDRVIKLEPLDKGEEQGIIGP